MLETLRRLASEKNPAARLVGGNARWTPAVSNAAVALNLPSWALYTGGSTAILYREGMSPIEVSVLEVRAGGPTRLEVLARWPLNMAMSNPDFTDRTRVQRALLCPQNSPEPCYFVICLPMPTPQQPDRIVCKRATTSALPISNPAEECYIDEHTGEVSCPSDVELDAVVIENFREHCYDVDGATLCDVQTSRGVVTLPVACCDSCAKGNECTECAGPRTNPRYGPLVLSSFGDTDPFLPRLWKKVRKFPTLGLLSQLFEVRA